MIAILFFVVIFAALGFYVWKDRASAKGNLSKLDAAVKAEAERLKKLIP